MLTSFLGRRSGCRARFLKLPGRLTMRMGETDLQGERFEISGLIGGTARRCGLAGATKQAAEDEAEDRATGENSRESSILSQGVGVTCGAVRPS